MFTGNKIKSLINPLHRIHFVDMFLLKLMAHNHLCTSHQHPKKTMHPLFALFLHHHLRLLLVMMVSRSM